MTARTVLAHFIQSNMRGESKHHILNRLQQREEIPGTNLAKEHNHAWKLCHQLAEDASFQGGLATGKYTRFAVGRSGGQLFAVLRAVDEWACRCDPSMKQATKDDDDQHRREALDRVLDITRRRISLEDSILFPEEPVQLGPWARDLKKIDVYGVLWHAREMGSREANAEGGIGKFCPRAFQSVQPLLDLVHGKPVYKQIDGCQIEFYDLSYFQK